MIPNDINENNIFSEVTALLNEANLHESILNENLMPHMKIESLMGNSSLIKRQIFDQICSVWSTAYLCVEEPFDEKSLPLDIIKTDQKLKDKVIFFNDFIRCWSNGTKYPYNYSFPEQPDSYDVLLMREVEFLLHDYCSQQYLTEYGKFKSTEMQTFITSHSYLKAINKKCSEILDFLLEECADWSLAQFSSN